MYLRAFLAVLLTLGAARSWAQSCASIYNDCHSHAVSDRNLCNNQCNAQYPPGAQRTACINGCTSTYNAQQSACSNAQSDCLASRQSNCDSGAIAICGGNNSVEFAQYNDSTQQCTVVCDCNPNTRPQCPGQGTASCSGGSWTCNSPILMPGSGGFELTSAEDGVPFDLACTGTPRQVAWTAWDNDEGWLVLDRNDNGRIDDGSEMFGSYTPQPPPPPGSLRNGFLALRVFDDPLSGGNSNGFIDPGDTVYSKLRVWQDLNHDGVTDTGELKALPEVGVGQLALEYQIKHKVDDYGNAFYYRAKAYDMEGHHSGLFVWDVFLTELP